MNRLRAATLTAALVASFAAGGAASAAGAPSEPAIVSGIEACLVLDRAAALRIPASRLPETAARCAAITKLLPVLRGR